jgi:hypothetical protein
LHNERRRLDVSDTETDAPESLWERANDVALYLTDEVLAEGVVSTLDLLDALATFGYTLEIDEDAAAAEYIEAVNAAREAYRGG